MENAHPWPCRPTRARQSWEEDLLQGVYPPGAPYAQGRRWGREKGGDLTRKLISLKRNKEPWYRRLPSLLLGQGWGTALGLRAVRARGGEGGTKGWGPRVKPALGPPFITTARLPPPTPSTPPQGLA